MSTLPSRVEKQIAGQCCYSGCREQADDGSDYCAPHDAHERGRDAGKKRRARQRLADAGLCRDGCGRKVGKRKRPDGTVMQRRCAACKKGRKRGVPGAIRGVPGDEAAPAQPARGFTKLDTGDKRQGRNAVERYVGRERRGSPSREDRDLDTLKDAGYAEDEIAKFKRAFARARSAEVQAMPRIQREHALRIAADHASYAARILESIAERLGK